jgi:hypothetical protein
MERLESRQLLAITVDIELDERDFLLNDGDISLRDAILEAAPGETINFAPTLDGAIIDLQSFLGEIAISKNLTIDASMLPNGITIDANDSDGVKNGNGMRIFNMTHATDGMTGQPCPRRSS